MSDPALEAFSRAISARYRIKRSLGAGGTATVYLAHDLKHDREVALNVLRPEIAATVGSARFLREVEIGSGLTPISMLNLLRRCRCTYN